ncbi:hypothetical protein MHU86_19777 [Fragilaria crotonensis]|nr:hypothetical protein MHU86_19777 [Fragilaria crotonensis]
MLRSLPSVFSTRGQRADPQLARQPDPDTQPDPDRSKLCRDLLVLARKAVTKDWYADATRPDHTLREVLMLAGVDDDVFKWCGPDNWNAKSRDCAIARVRSDDSRLSKLRAAFLVGELSRLLRAPTPGSGLEPSAALDLEFINHVGSYADGRGGSAAALIYLGKILEVVRNAIPAIPVDAAREGRRDVLLSDSSSRAIIEQCYNCRDIDNVDAAYLAVAEDVMVLGYSRSAVSKARQLSSPAGALIKRTEDNGALLDAAVAAGLAARAPKLRSDDDLQRYTLNALLLNAEGDTLSEGDSFPSHAVFPNLLAAALSSDLTTRDARWHLGRYFLAVAANEASVEAVAGRLKHALDRKESYISPRPEMPGFPLLVCVRPPRKYSFSTRAGLPSPTPASWWVSAAPDVPRSSAPLQSTSELSRASSDVGEASQSATELSDSRCDDLGFLDQFYHGTAALDLDHAAILGDLRSSAPPTVPPTWKPPLDERAIKRSDLRSSAPPTVPPTWKPPRAFRSGGGRWAVSTAPRFGGSSGAAVLVSREVSFNVVLFTCLPLSLLSIALGIAVASGLLTWISSLGPSLVSSGVALLSAVSVFGLTRLYSDHPIKTWHFGDWGLAYALHRLEFQSDRARDSFAASAYLAGVDAVALGGDCLSSLCGSEESVSLKAVSAPGLRADLLGRTRSGNIYRPPGSSALYIQADWYIPSLRALASLRYPGYDWPALPERRTGARDVYVSHVIRLPPVSAWSKTPATYVGNAKAAISLVSRGGLVCHPDSGTVLTRRVSACAWTAKENPGQLRVNASTAHVAWA